MKIAIVTACPSGVANSIIAAGLMQENKKKIWGGAQIASDSPKNSGPTPNEKGKKKTDLVILAPVRRGEF
ncbi:hypothetical protein [Vibrio cholerae]|uniref:hypothetical protein n=1 Tax=Vibrio cholerae TaxID=666 RepID=UPI00209D3DD0|nr:hypothetical protein [Vibrio cholerae]